MDHLMRPRKRAFLLLSYRVTWREITWCFFTRKYSRACYGLAT